MNDLVTAKIVLVFDNHYKIVTIVTSIGEAVFTGCELVDSIVVAADNPVYDSRGGCNAVIETKTNTLRIGGPLTIIPEGIISISSYAYIKSPHYAVVIPESVTSIGEKAMFFQRDQFVLCRAKNPPALSDSSFVRVPKEGVDNFYNSYAYVPEGTMSEYQSSEWSSFFSNIEEVAGQAIATGKCNGNLTWKLTVSGEFIVEGEGDLLEMDVHFGDFESIMNSIIIKHGVTSIGAALFKGINPYYSLLTISLPETLTSIGEQAFYYSKFGSVTLPESLVSIGNEALCCNPFAATLPTIFIPKNVKSIGVCPFFVDSIFIDEANKYFYVHDYAIIEKNSGTLIRASNSTRTIPEGVNTIGHSAFWGNPISSIVIPESVTSIETKAFGGSELESVTFSKNLISIGDVAFENCGISSIDLPESLTSIGNNAFKAIPITSIFIPKNVKSIGNSPFMYCDKLESIVVDEDNEYYDSRNGCNAILKTISNKLISGCKSTIIPEGTDSISVEAFAGCYNLTSIVIPEGVTSIGDRVFLECYNLTSVVMPESVTSLGLLMFYSCNNLSSVNIPKGVTSIPAATFQYCGALSSFTIPEWVTSVGSKAFESCGGLKSINFPKGGINIGPEAFSGCYSLTSVELPEGETYIGAEAFRSCSSLNSVVISEGVTNIESEAFSNCSGLATVVLPSSLPAMQKDLFVRCDSLSSIICYADTPLVLSSEGFLGGLDRSKCTLYVPSASIDDYKNAAYWNTFARIAEISTSVTYIVDNEVYYTMAAARGDSLYLIDEPVKEGYSFSGWSRLPAIMPMYNVTVIGTFTPNMYKITYEIDGVLETRIDSLACDDIFVIPWEGPKGVGFTFSGWSGVPEKMPPHDIVLTGTTTHNRHKITFVVDEEIYSVDSAYYNANISFYFPTKRGHTFIANDSVPETMPDHDLTIEGTFVANVYKLTFMIDGEVYATDSLLCDAPIVAPELPVREGHFASWDNIPATMPDMDWVIRAVYVKKQYYVTFVLDGETIYSKLQVYDSDIVAPVVPEKEGYTFSGWGDVDATVPAHDVIYEGNYIVNTYKVYYYVGEELVHTDEVAFGEVIPEYTYEPTDGGYTFLGWAGEIYVTMPAHDVKYTANTINSIGQLTIDASKCIIYDLNGNRITDVDNLKRGIYIVNGKKVMIK